MSRINLGNTIIHLC